MEIMSPVFKGTSRTVRRDDDEPARRRGGRRAATGHSSSTRSPTLTPNRAAPVLTSKYWTTMSRRSEGPAYRKAAVHVAAGQSTAPSPDAVTQGVTALRA